MGLCCRPWPDLVASIAAVAEFGENEEKVLDRDNAIQIDVCGAFGLTAEFAEHEKHVTDGDHAVQIQVLWAIRVANPVAIDVRQTSAATDAQGIDPVQAGPIVVGCFGIEVAGQGVQAAE